MMSPAAVCLLLRQRMQILQVCFLIAFAVLVRPT